MFCKLSDLDIGQNAVITKVLASEEMHRRFLDIGMVEKTKIKCVLKANGQDPLAFLIRGTVVAIRKSDCEKIEVSIDNEEGGNE